MLSVESKVVKQWVQMLALPQAVNDTLEDQLHSACMGMWWRDYAAGQRCPHVTAAWSQREPTGSDPNQ